MKPKFKLQTKIGQTVYLINFNITDPTSKPCSLYKEGIEVIKLKIVFQTSRRIALSDKWITSLDRQEADKKKDSCYNYLEDISVRVKTNETYFPNGVFATCYTLQEPEKVINKIKNEIAAHVKNKYSFMFDSNFNEKLNNYNI